MPALNKYVKDLGLWLTDKAFITQILYQVMFGVGISHSIFWPCLGDVYHNLVDHRTQSE